MWETNTKVRIIVLIPSGEARYTLNLAVLNRDVPQDWSSLDQNIMKTFLV